MSPYYPVLALAGCLLFVVGLLLSTDRRHRARSRALVAELETEQKEARLLGDELTIAQTELAEMRSLIPASGEHQLALWQRKYWEMNDLVAECLQQRDVWKDMWFTQSAEHLEGQATLEQKIVQMRQNLIRGIATCNRLMKERSEESGKAFKAITMPDDLDPIDSAPVGQAAAYRDRMMQLLAGSPRPFDALAHRDSITLGSGAKGLFRVRPLTTRAKRLSEAETVETPFGPVRGQAGDWIVRDINGKPSVIGHDVFKRSYVEVPHKLIDAAEAQSDTGLQEGEEVFVQVLSEPEPA
jgi:hypothetical protein